MVKQQLFATGPRPRYETPVPDFYDPSKIDQIFSPDMMALHRNAPIWAKQHGIRNAATDATSGLKIGFVGIDIQLTFVFEMLRQLFVEGSPKDCLRTAEFIYRNLGLITRTFFTLDTHDEWQVFHPPFAQDANGNPPTPGVPISDEDIQSGKWRVNPAASFAHFHVPNLPKVKNHLRYYSGQLEARNEKAKQAGTLESFGGVYPYIPWPFHSMLGDIGHAISPLVHEAALFHSLVRGSKVFRSVKGTEWGDESYSPFGGEVGKDCEGKPMGQKNIDLFKTLQWYDVLILAGQAKSHCVRAFIADLLGFIRQYAPHMVENVYLVEDLTSPVVIRNEKGEVVVDFTESANQSFEAFRGEGMHVVKSIDPLHTWGGKLAQLATLA